ncbi:ATP-binding cassette domain-containing protein [Cesiribacter sp. SM1]|uniref:ATP-binding cassette domain-containing protein n=1 Tax=Cesiribacter sp. SM1 TaxID=2861196 RepID=UPI001CD5B957|nr:ATP-binding cassette domain-containing protein [Cesiribacter sp. SM1]
MNDLLVSFDGITVRYLDKLIFENLDFRIEKGHNWAITGPSGSGKTALLETIAGSFNIVNGEASYPFFDQLVKKNRITDPLIRWRQFIALISSRHNFRTLSNTTEIYYQQRFNAADVENLPSVKDYLLSQQALFPSPVWNYQYTIERLRLIPLQDKQLIMLSNGETKRLLIAAALLRNPVLLLLDNPLSGLDVEARKDFNTLLEEIIDSGIQVVMTTSPTEIPDAITHIAMLENGKITRQLPKSSFAAEEVPAVASPDIDTRELERLLAINAFGNYNTMIEMKEVSITYGSKVVLDNINWKVEQGERWALLGHNGAGKSTLLSLINADNPQAYANHIVLFDVQKGHGASIWDIKKKIGFVSPELFQYFPTDSSCLQVVESGFHETLGFLRFQSPESTNLARRWMQLLEIEQFGSKTFRHVSASIQRLCLLARALVKNPPLLILDEPVQGLDSHQQEHFKAVVDLICQKGNTTLIYVSHYQHEIPQCVTHTLRLERGRVV